MIQRYRSYFPSADHARQLFIGVVGLIPLSILAWFLYGDSFAGFWRYDDPAILQQVADYAPWQYFVSPQASRALQPFNLNPLLSFSFYIDQSLFGLRPQAFYLHHFLLIVLLSVAVIRLLTYWARPEWAYLGGLFFLTGSPLAIVAQQLMCRHYLEGLLFTTLAAIFFARTLQRDTTEGPYLSAFFYACAIACKEVYIPFPLVLLFFPGHNFPWRFRCLRPHLALLAAYLLWRRYMLGSFVGGMGLLVDYRQAGSLLWRVWEFFFGPAWLPLTLALLAAIAWRLGRRKTYWRFGLVWGGAIAGPLLPITSMIQDTDRYFLPLWWSLCLIVAVSLERLSGGAKNLSRIAAILLFLFFSGGALWKNHLTQARWAPTHREFDVQGRFLWQAEEKDAVILSPQLARNYWYVLGLERMKQKGNPSRKSVVFYVDEVEYRSALESGKRLWNYRATTTKMERMEKEATERMRLWQERASTRPLSIFLSYDRANGMFEWRFGPYPQGKYIAITDTGGVWELPAVGRIRSDAQNGFKVLLRYDSPQGWITYSDTMVFDPREKNTLQWERK